MSENDAHEIGPQQIDRVLEFLPIFENQDFRFGEWCQPEGQIPYFSYSHGVTDFIQTLYQQQVIIPFDWPNWGQEAQHYQIEPGALEGADLPTLRKLLTAHVRADRFSEGHLASVLKSGHITAILRRLKQIRDQTSHGG